MKASRLLTIVAFGLSLIVAVGGHVPFNSGLVDLAVADVLLALAILL